MREILEARIRDPRTSTRDLASLVNSLAKLDEKQEAAEWPSILDHRILEQLSERARLCQLERNQLAGTSGAIENEREVAPGKQVDS